MIILSSASELNHYCQVRDAEQKLGQQLQLPQPAFTLAQQLAHSKNLGCRYVLLGVPEDIGPRANFGQPGAAAGWQAFLTKFVNLQHNAFIDPGHFLLLGALDCTDLQQQAAALSAEVPEQLQQLRQLVIELDQRLSTVAQAILAADLYPIIIGGGHNNSFPLLRALTEASGVSANSANLDPHADFRPLEGRHSGNGFSYAHHQQYLDKYFVLGLHELKNSASTLQLLQAAGADYCSYQRIFVRQELSFQQALDNCIDFVVQGSGDIGIEVDTDSISLMPVSAFTNCGISLPCAEQYVYQLARLPRSKYLHLAEAAPQQHPAGFNAGINEAGQVLAALVYAFVQGKQQQPPAI